MLELHANTFTSFRDRCEEFTNLLASGHDLVDTDDNQFSSKLETHLVKSGRHFSDYNPFIQKVIGLSITLILCIEVLIAVALSEQYSSMVSLSKFASVYTESHRAGVSFIKLINAQRGRIVTPN